MISNLQFLEKLTEFLEINPTCSLVRFLREVISKSVKPMTPSTPATGDPGTCPSPPTFSSYATTSPPNFEKIRLEFKANTPLFDAWTSLMVVFSRFQQADSSFAVHPKSETTLAGKLDSFKAKNGNESKFHCYFNHSVTSKNGDGNRHWITCRISSKKSFTDLKHESQAWLKTNNIFAYKHPFEQTTISVAGLLFGINPHHVHRDTISKLLNNLAKEKKLVFNCVLRQKSLGSTKKEDNNDNKPASTQTSVLELQCPSSLFHDSMEFLSMTDTTAYCPGAVFIPATYAKSTSKETFQLALSQHHSQISKQTTIPIEGLHPDAAHDFNDCGENILEYLNDRLNQRNDKDPAFLALQPTAQTETKGRWFIITSASQYQIMGQRLDKALKDLHEAISHQKLPTFEGTKPHRTNNNRASTLVSSHINQLVQTYGGNPQTEDLPQAASIALQQARSQALPTQRIQQNAWTRKASIAVLNPEEFKTLSETAQTKKPQTITKTNTKQASPISTVTSQQTTINTDDIAAKIASTLDEKLELKINNKIDSALALRVTNPLEKIAQSIENLVQQNAALNDRITKIESFLTTHSHQFPTPQPHAYNTSPSYSTTQTTEHSSFQETPRTPSDIQARLEHFHDQHHTPLLTPQPPSNQLTSLGLACAKSRSLFSQPDKLETQELTVKDMSILDCSHIDRAADDSFAEDDIDTAFEQSSGGA